MEERSSGAVGEEKSAGRQIQDGVGCEQKGHSPQADQVSPIVPNDMLGDVREIFLQITVTGADQKKILRRSGFELAHRIDLTGNSNQRVFRRLIAIRGRIDGGPLNMWIV